MTTPTVKILAATVRVSCGCGRPFVAAIDDYTNFARCPHCNNVVWLDASAKVHEMDPVEHPDKDMIANGELEAEAFTPESAAALATALTEESRDLPAKDPRRAGRTASTLMDVYLRGRKDRSGA